MAAIEKERLPCAVYFHGLSIKIPQSQFPSIDCLYVISRDEKKYFSVIGLGLDQAFYRLFDFLSKQEIMELQKIQNLNFTGTHPDLMSVDDIHVLSSFLSDLNIDLYYKIHPKK